MHQQNRLNSRFVVFFYKVVVDKNCVFSEVHRSLYIHETRTRKISVEESSVVNLPLNLVL